MITREMPQGLSAPPRPSPKGREGKIAVVMPQYMRFVLPSVFVRLPVKKQRFFFYPDKACKPVYKKGYTLFFALFRPIFTIWRKVFRIWRKVFRIRHKVFRIWHFGYIF